MSRTLLDCPYCGEMYEEGRTHLCPEGRKWNENSLWHQYAAAASNWALGDACADYKESAEYAANYADAMIEEARKRGRV